VKEFEKKNNNKEKNEQKKFTLQPVLAIFFNSFLFASEIKFNFIFPSFLMSG